MEACSGGDGGRGGRACCGGAAPSGGGLHAGAGRQWLRPEPGEAAAGNAGNGRRGFVWSLGRKGAAAAAPVAGKGDGRPELREAAGAAVVVGVTSDGDRPRLREGIAGGWRWLVR